MFGCHLGELGWGRIAVLVKARVWIGRSWDDVVVDVRHYLGGKGAWMEEVSRWGEGGPVEKGTSYEADGRWEGCMIESGTGESQPGWD